MMHTSHPSGNLAHLIEEHQRCLSHRSISSFTEIAGISCETTNGLVLPPPAIPIIGAMTKTPIRRRRHRRSEWSESAPVVVLHDSDGGGLTFHTITMIEAHKGASIRHADFEVAEDTSIKSFVHVNFSASTGRRQQSRQRMSKRR
jgi:hypothetical protein